MPSGMKQHKEAHLHMRIPAIIYGIYLIWVSEAFWPRIDMWVSFCIIVVIILFLFKQKKKKKKRLCTDYLAVPTNGLMKRFNTHKIW